MQACEDGTDSSGWPRSTGDGLGVNEMAAAKPAPQAAGCEAALVAKLPPRGLHLRAS